jgi:hypothetical protein
MLKILLHRRLSSPPEHLARCAVLGLLLLLAACAGGNETPDNGKPHGVYGGVTGGWSHP